MAVVVFLCLFTMGKERQGWRLLLTTAFPGLRVEGSSHPELIAEVRPLIETSRSNIMAYHLSDAQIKDFTEKPSLYPQYPSWAALDGKKIRPNVMPSTVASYSNPSATTLSSSPQSRPCGCLPAHLRVMFTSFPGASFLMK
jgi:hypothetical protein